METNVKAKEAFETLTVTVIFFDNEDVITTSSNDRTEWD